MTIRPIWRALISMSDKTGLDALVDALIERGVEIVSTGGTAAAIRARGAEVIDVADLTGFPEMLDGRVKTLHPHVHGGLLARRDLDAHADALRAHDIGEIDLLVVDLYPFERALAAGADVDAQIEQIDVGGPAMIRSAAKNHASVAVLVDAEDHAEALAAIRAEGGLDDPTRRRLAAKAFARTAAYDAAIADWMAKLTGDAQPKRRVVAGERIATLRYGENPHQASTLYASVDPVEAARPGPATARSVQGKPLSHNNIVDADAAFALVSEMAGLATPDRPAACVVVKHANPCGAALGATARAAYADALAADRVSAFGGVVALSTPIDAEAAAAILEIFTEVVIAPDADAAAVASFAEKPNIRLLLTGGLTSPDARRRVLRSVAGGFLEQTADPGGLDMAAFRVVTARGPSMDEATDLRLAWAVAGHVASNAIVYAKGGRVVGVGAGQMSRVDSARLAAAKAQAMAEAERGAGAASEAAGAVAASDAFFPFADGLEALVAAGVTAVIQPGGSVRDDEVIAAADAAGLAMAFTGMRRFRH